MRHLSIDFGKRYIGLALSDEDGNFAFPERVLEHPTDAVGEIREIAKQKNVGAIVLGESRDFNGNDNAIMQHIRTFKTKLEASFDDSFRPAVYLEPEFLTSHQATKLQDKSDNLHASAAALILQSFLDRKNAAKTDPNDQELNGRWQKDRPEIV